MWFVLILVAASTYVALAGGANQVERNLSPIPYRQNEKNEFLFPFKRYYNDTELPKQSKDSKPNYPFMAIVNEYAGDPDEYTWSTCSGAIVDNFHVLVPGHCVCVYASKSRYCKKLKAKNLFIRVGNTSYVDKVKISDALRVSKVIVHELFRRPVADQCFAEFDIAVLRMAKPLVFSDTVSRVKLPKKVSVSTNLLSTNSCVILGFFEAYDNHTIVSMTTAKPHFRTNCFRHHYTCKINTLCVTGGAYNIIHHGDSVDPLVCDGELVGMHSGLTINPYYAKHYVNIFSRVDTYLKFITRVTGYTRRYYNKNKYPSVEKV